MDFTKGNTAIGAQQLEDILAEIGRQILEGGLSATSGLGGWGCTSVRVEVSPDRVQEVIDAGACRIGACAAEPASLTNMAGYIDHTILKPDATAEDVDRICDEALRHQFATVCVNGTWAKRCAEILSASPTKVCCVVGFPLGAVAPEVKAYEARRAIEDGACEIDMVLNVGALKSGDDEFVRRDIAGVADVCHRLGAQLKVILETCLLTDAEKVRACEISKEAGADFVKTSTGFSTGGATVDDVALMRRTVGPIMGVKASGGVRDEEGAKRMIEAGATRIGASASVAIVRGDAAVGDGG
jgi:deoxyribose-phosphate aldolase